MVPIILKVINWLTKNFKVVAVSIIMLLSAISFYMNQLLQQKNKEIDRLTNNVEYYRDAVDGLIDENRVLLITIDELNQSKDSLIQRIKTVLDELKIKDKNIVNVNVINTEVKDSIKTVIKTVDKNFTEELKLNQLTKIIVSRTDSILTARLDLQNELILFVEEKKVYKRQYKNGWLRFLHFDWKKKRIRNYQIKNSNELIKVIDTRVIEVNK